MSILHDPPQSDDPPKILQAEFLPMVDALDEPDEWKAARRLELARIDDRLWTGFMRGASMDDLLRTARPQAAAAVRTNWCPPRGSRRMPSIKKIVAYWVARPPFCVDPSRPECFGCRRSAPQWSSSYFERAHLVDHALGGLDHEGNLALLCASCHRVMPMFDVEEGDAAIDWVLCGGWTRLILEV